MKDTVTTMRVEFRVKDLMLSGLALALFAMGLILIATN